MKIVIIGRTEMLYDSACLLAKQHRIAGIITAPSMPEYAKKEEDFRQLAETLACPYLCITQLNDTVKQLIASCEADIGISVNWVSVINEDVTTLLPHGILNAHFGDLPSYRGNAVINWALLKHEPSITLTIHRMQPGELDSGDIILQSQMALNQDSTIRDIVNFAQTNVPTMFLSAIEGLASGQLKPMSQELTDKVIFRCYPRLPIDSKIDWSLPANDIHALIRASTHPYSGAYSYIKIDGKIKKVFIWDSRIVMDKCNDIGSVGHIIKNDKESGESWVYTGQGILAIKLAQYQGEDFEFKPGTIWKSIRMRFGIDIEEEIIKINEIISRME